MMFDKCLLLVAQCLNEISYQRRQSILFGLTTNQNTIKDILKNQSETLDAAENSYLFGPSFGFILDEKLAKESTAKTEANSVFTALKKTSLHFSGSFYQRHPFRRGSFFRQVKADKATQEEGGRHLLGLYKKEVRKTCLISPYVNLVL